MLAKASNRPWLSPLSSSLPPLSQNLQSRMPSLSSLYFKMEISMTPRLAYQRESEVHRAALQPSLFLISTPAAGPHTPLPFPTERR